MSWFTKSSLRWNSFDKTIKNNSKMMKAVFYFGLIFTAASITFSGAVDITNFQVPNSYILDDDKTKPLILDCAYDISPNETGLVVKWLFNGLNIYQWIINQKPFALGVMKKHIDTTYSPSSEKNDQYRAISITNPQWNMTGNYTCSVQTFQGVSKKTSELKIIKPESDFKLAAEVDKELDDLDVTCSVEDIFPPPHLAILINGVQLSTEIKAEKDTKGPFDVTATSKKALDEIESPATVTCILTIPGTDYEKREETVFSAPAPVETEFLERTEIDIDFEQPLANMESTSEQLEGNASCLHPLTLLSVVSIFTAIFFS